MSRDGERPPGATGMEAGALRELWLRQHPDGARKRVPLRTPRVQTAVGRGGVGPGRRSHRRGAETPVRFLPPTKCAPRSQAATWEYSRYTRRSSPGQIGLAEGSQNDNLGYFLHTNILQQPPAGTHDHLLAHTMPEAELGGTEQLRRPNR